MRRRIDGVISAAAVGTPYKRYGKDTRCCVKPTSVGRSQRRSKVADQTCQVRMDPESLYRQLGQLVAESPDFGRRGPLDEVTQRWLGRAGALIERCCGYADVAHFTAASDNMVGLLRETSTQAVLSILNRALARAELDAPAAAQGAFIPVGGHFDAFQAIGKVFAAGKADILIVDPYVDETVMTQFAALAQEGVRIRLLGDERFKDCGVRLLAATRAWATQYGNLRPVDVRRAAAKSLHDRLVVVDNGAEAWSVGQSMKDIAKSSPTAFIRVPPGIVAEKVAHYENLWSMSGVLS